MSIKFKEFILRCMVVIVAIIIAGVIPASIWLLIYICKHLTIGWR